MQAVVTTSLSPPAGRFTPPEDVPASVERHQRQPSLPTGLQKPTMQSQYMHSRNASSDLPSLGGDRWRLNGAGQLVDAETTPEWDLADQIVRLNLGGGEADELRGQMRTPPNSKNSTTAVAQFTETSPLESSDASAGSSSPEPSQNSRGSAIHSRDSSADTTDSGSRNLRVPPLTPPQVGAVGEQRERPHSYSGGLSMADLRRLQQAGGSPVAKPPSGDTTPQQPQQREWSTPNQSDQPTYPSLTGNPTVIHVPAQRPQPPVVNAPVVMTSLAPRQDELETDYQMQQRQFNSLGPALGSPGVPSFRPNNGLAPIPFRQSARLPGPVPPQAGFPYPAQHQQALSMGTPQQMYDMMLPNIVHENPAVARIQQQHGAFRPTHSHSASDPASLREAATLAQLLAANNLQAFPAGAGVPGMYPALTTPPPLAAVYGNQFYQPQDMYAINDLAAHAQLVAANRLQPQYTGPYNAAAPAQSAGLNGSINPVQVEVNPNGSGPSANNRKLGLYKTELCRSWEEKGTCRYGTKCQFAHGEEELRVVARHPKYKTEICRTFWVSGSCPYGKRCCFIHTELPAGSAPPGADGTPPPTNLTNGQRARSMSTNSDPNDASTSLLARISAKRNQGSSPSANVPGAATPVDVTPQATFALGSRPGALRVDTTALGSTASKENKSAFPTFNSGMILPTNEQPNMSPIAVTAHPDFGRNGRLDLNQNQTRLGKGASSPNNRHSFNGTEISLDLANVASAPTPTTSLAVSPPQRHTQPRANGHVRAGSAGNWPTTFRSSRLAAPSPYSSVPGNELKTASPWTSELAIGSSRRN
ncbi:hypothetical protein PUNSTDRAFT_117353 [Punctularia strigosozonata HHB-11173 SS5]|uniref:uncharacterized protein n=1 Tax=Punctularia strigosozonata (strain HHB-11173) TaxID=741275 RepID=UPI0004416610|nr:uncharacterized protein PUNSTDRAFT_117353 [Punctularia strigosozonata HHB-11173 SS5]EIN13634.1 hypothetical protein PUNSTDRAFT_117353 [Punctularia strigosozonata HHB-11173 SS5]